MEFFFLPHQISLCGFQNSVFSCLWSFCICHSTSPLSCHLQDRKMKVQIYWALNDKPRIILRVVFCLLMHSASSAAVWRGRPCYPGITEKGRDTQNSWVTCLRFLRYKKWELGAQGTGSQARYCTASGCVFFFFQKIQNTHGMPLLCSHLKEELCTWAFSSPCLLLVWCMQYCVLELRGHSCLPLNTVRRRCEKENKFPPFITSYFLWFTK